jgi:ribosome-binding protein aMBF1 (putative translation factor)
MQIHLATKSRASAPKAVAQPQDARVTFRLNQSQAAKIGLLDRWESAMRRRRPRDEKKRQAMTRLNESISRLLEMAKAEEWSQRQLAAKIAIPETTFRRLRSQNVNPLVWLPKVEAALLRLTVS